MLKAECRDILVHRITDVIGNLLYGTIFMNHFSGQPKSVEIQASDIIDVVFHGILCSQELQRTKNIFELCLSNQKPTKLFDRRRANQIYRERQVNSACKRYSTFCLLLVFAILTGCKKQAMSPAQAGAAPKPPEVID